MSNGDIEAQMGATGFSPGIGILPNWEALYLTSGDARAYNSLVANSFHLRSYPMCLGRDATTKRPIKPSSFSNWTNDGPAQGVEPDFWHAGSLDWESAHHPSIGYTGYLLTGDYDHLETMLLQSSLLYLGVQHTHGLGTARILDGQIRGDGWTTRTLGQLCALAPDQGDAVIAEYATLFSAQISHWKDKASVPGASQIGYPIASSTYEETLPLSQAPWQFHFWIQSNGHVWDIEAMTDATDIANLEFIRDFMYQAAVGILGPNGVANYCFTKASNYNLTVSDDVVLNFVETGADRLYQTWGEVFEATHGSPNNSCANTLEGSSAGAPFITGGYWANLMPAIAFAVDHGATGAQAAWDRLTGANNWAGLRDAGWDDVPVWGIVPRNWSG
jgi:hypothetical protein